MSPSTTDTPTPFDPDAGTLPEALSALLIGAGSPPPAIALIAGDEAMESGWAQRAAIALAASLVDGGGRVVLADLGFERPSLHEPLEQTNDEGLADVFLFGTSLRRVARPVARHGFFFVPPGPYTPNPAEVLRHPRWERLLESLSEAQATLIALAPAGVPGLDSFASRVGTVVLLVEASEAEPTAAALPAGSEPAVVLVPPAATPAAPGEEDTFATLFEDELRRADEAPAPEDGPDAEATPGPREPAAAGYRASPEPGSAGAEDAYAETLDADSAGADDDVAYTGVLESPQPAPPPVTPRAHLIRADPDEEERELGLPPSSAVGEPARTRDGGGRWWMWLVTPLLLGLLAYGGWLGYLYFVEEQGAGASAGAVAGSGAASTAPAVPYSVVVETHQDLDAAFERAAELAGAEASAAFQVVPVLVDSVIYYRVLAGPLSTREQASALLNRLVQEGHVPGADPFAVRMTRLAFLVAETPDAQAAEARIQALRGQGVPAYGVDVPAAGGGVVWRVYAGAYESAESARIMEELLAGVDVDAPLVERTGRSLDVPTSPSP